MSLTVQIIYIIRGNKRVNIILKFPLIMLVQQLRTVSENSRYV